MKALRAKLQVILLWRYLFPIFIRLRTIPLKSEMMRRWQRLWRASKNTEFSSLPLLELMSLAATSLFPVIEDTVHQSLREKRRCRVS